MSPRPAGSAGSSATPGVQWSVQGQTPYGHVQQPLGLARARDGPWPAVAVPGWRLLGFSWVSSCVTSSVSSCNFCRSDSDCLCNRSFLLQVNGFWWSNLQIFAVISSCTWLYYFVTGFSISQVGIIFNHCLIQGAWQIPAIHASQACSRLEGGWCYCCFHGTQAHAKQFASNFAE